MATIAKKRQPRLALPEGPGLRRKFAQSMTDPKDIRTLLAHDSSHAVKMGLSLNKNTPSDIIDDFATTGATSLKQKLVYRHDLSTLAAHTLLFDEVVTEKRPLLERNSFSSEDLTIIWEQRIKPLVEVNDGILHYEIDDFLRSSGMSEDLARDVIHHLEEMINRYKDENVINGKRWRFDDKYSLLLTNLTSILRHTIHVDLVRPYFDVDIPDALQCAAAENRHLTAKDMYQILDNGSEVAINALAKRSHLTWRTDLPVEIQQAILDRPHAKHKGHNFHRSLLSLKEIDSTVIANYNPINESEICDIVGNAATTDARRLDFLTQALEAHRKFLVKKEAGENTDKMSYNDISRLAHSIADAHQGDLTLIQMVLTCLDGDWFHINSLFRTSTISLKDYLVLIETDNVDVRRAIARWKGTPLKVRKILRDDPDTRVSEIAFRW